VPFLQGRVLTLIEGQLLKTDEVAIIGGGLAGSEIALQLASRGRRVRLIEMRPEHSTPAHNTPYLAELVCSNSLKSDHPETASGLLKRELRMLGCRLLELAEDSKVPAGHALAVDRERFARSVTGVVERVPSISIERFEQEDLDVPPCSIIATGPLTSSPLSHALAAHLGSEHLYVYDAISISVAAASVNEERVFRASRYGKGGDDYLNIAFSREEYDRFVQFLRKAPTQEKRGFEDTRCFEACLPIEVIAGRGEESIRFGPLKPKGLADPATGREPHAVLQLRQETIDGAMLGLVGFQTRLTRPAQRELMRLIPGLDGAEILRWGSIHRNTFIDAPRLLDGKQMSRKRAGLFFAGQIVGVEGYMESIAHGLVTALNVERYLDAKEDLRFPRETLLGALQAHISGGGEPFQPMNANFGILPPIHGSKRRRRALLAERSLESLKRYLSMNLRD
jgi:methylenetetrahydrofolate--tRNA-(uracil-5-)-methyltransferase